MKFILNLTFYLSALILISCNSGSGPELNSIKENSSISGAAEIVFKDYEHDFGKVAEGEKVAYIFAFENKGTGDLVINSTSTSCGCTVTKYESKPVKPGGHGSLEVEFSTSGRNGKQTKTISVHSNSRTPVVVLKITAEVVQKSSRN